MWVKALTETKEKQGSLSHIANTVPGQISSRRVMSVYKYCDCIRILFY